MRLVPALQRSRALAAALILAAPIAAVSPVAADGGDWRALLPAPELHVRFEDGDQGAPCAALPSTPDPSAVECWAAYVDRAVSKRTSPLTEESELACIEEWEVVEPLQAGCPWDAARCVRADVGLFERVPDELPIDTNISATWALAAELAREYTAFQTLRSGHALNPHRPRISGLALSQGMLVLYRAQAISALRRELEAGDCGTDHLEPYFELASRVAEEVGRSDVPEILETFPEPGREWSRRFHRVQLAVLARNDAVRADGAWREDCSKARELGMRVGRLDADVNVWCGYAYELVGEPDHATLHWTLARHSPHHPEAASYAARRLGIVGPGRTTAELRR